MEAASGLRPLAPGTMLDAKYRIDMLLAVGGMGAVYVGTHVALRKKVAIKVLNPQLTSPAMLQRFQREAITASQIGHEGIAQVTDLGTSSDGNAFLVMEFLEGEPLSARLKANGPMPVELACELGCAILSPLAAAHAAGIVHRDLKPDNVFLVRQSRGEMVKLLDFGISRAQGLEAEMRLTNTGVVMGTPYYMSPEQARGDSEITPASDIYSFGVILYEMLVGEVPIRGENYNQLMYRVMTGEYARLRTKRPEIPVELESIIERAMATDAALRWTSATELEQALLAFCRPGYREHMIERISNPGMGLATPTPWRASQPGYGSHPGYGSQPGIAKAGTSPPGVQAPINQGTDPTLLAPSYIREPKRSKLPLVIIALVVLGGGAAALVAMSGGNEPEKPTVAEKAPPAAPSDTPAAAPAPTPTPSPTPPPPPAEPATVTIKFAVTPSNATIKLDGKDVSGEVSQPKDDVEHELTVTAAGYVAHSEKIRFDESQRISVTLAKQAKAAPTGRPKTGGKKDKIEVDSPYKD